MFLQKNLSLLVDKRLPRAALRRDFGVHFASYCSTKNTFLCARCHPSDAHSVMVQNKMKHSFLCDAMYTKLELIFKKHIR